MSHIVESCLLIKLNGGLSRLHSADEDAVSLLTRIQEEEEDRLPTNSNAASNDKSWNKITNATK